MKPNVMEKVPLRKKAKLVMWSHTSQRKWNDLYAACGGAPVETKATTQKSFLHVPLVKPHLD